MPRRDDGAALRRLRSDLPLSAAKLLGLVQSSEMADRSYLEEVQISDAWRDFARAYSRLPPSGRWSEWEKLSEEQKQNFTAAWKALGYPAWEIPPERSNTDSAAVVPPSKCGNCRGTTFTPLAEQPNKGTGCVLLAVGVLLAPVLIGIVIIIWAVGMMGESRRWWVCNSCGARLPRAGPVKTATGWK